MTSANSHQGPQDNEQPQMILMPQQFVAWSGAWASNHETPCIDTLLGRSIMAPAMNNDKPSPCKMISGCTRRCTSGVIKGHDTSIETLEVFENRG